MLETLADNLLGKLWHTRCLAWRTQLTLSWSYYAAGLDPKSVSNVWTQNGKDNLLLGWLSNHVVTTVQPSSILERFPGKKTRLLTRVSSLILFLYLCYIILTYLVSCNNKCINQVIKCKYFGWLFQTVSSPHLKFLTGESVHSGHTRNWAWKKLFLKMQFQDWPI